MMNKTLTLIFMALALTAITACNNQNDNSTTGSLGAGEETDASAATEADTSITMDPDTTTEHDMAL